MEIIGTGLSGLVGSRITALLSPDFSFVDLSKETGVDIMDFSCVRDRISASPSSWVFHFAAYTNVQAAQDEKEKGKESISWRVNVEATKHIAEVCRDTGKRLLYISTDYVFDGTKGIYDEKDIPNPISWYGQTKYEGEKAGEILGDRFLIVRISTPYRSAPVGKIDFVHKIKERLEQKELINAPNNQTFSPTFIDDLAAALRLLISSSASGIYHVGAASGITPYEAALEVASVFGFSRKAVQPVSYKEYFTHKAPAPQHAVLKHDKIDTLAVCLHTFQEGLEEVRNQERNTL